MILLAGLVDRSTLWFISIWWSAWTQMCREKTTEEMDNLMVPAIPFGVSI